MGYGPATPQAESRMQAGMIPQEVGSPEQHLNSIGYGPTIPSQQQNIAGNMEGENPMGKSTNDNYTPDYAAPMARLEQAEATIYKPMGAQSKGTLAMGELVEKRQFSFGGPFRRRSGFRRRFGFRSWSGSRFGFRRRCFIDQFGFTRCDF